MGLLNEKRNNRDQRCGATHTGARLVSFMPPKPSKNRSTAGRRKTSPMTGVSFMLCAAMGKNWPNRYTRPYSCAIMPNTGQRIKTRKTPPKKATMPFMRSGREKKRNVRDTPMVKVRPVKKRMSPSASMAESNMKMHPRNKNTQPRNSKPVPILVLSENILLFVVCFLRRFGLETRTG
jgi:hypothetical protein